MKGISSNIIIDAKDFVNFIKLREKHYPNGSKIYFLFENKEVECIVNENTGLIEKEIYYKNEKMYMIKTYYILPDDTRILFTEETYNKNGNLHSYNDKPAYIKYDVNSFYKNKKFLPILFASWYSNGYMHRKIYPADIYYESNGKKLEDYYLFGKYFDENDFFNFSILSNIDNLTREYIIRYLEED